MKNLARLEDISAQLTDGERVVIFYALSGMVIENSFGSPPWWWTTYHKGALERMWHTFQCQPKEKDGCDE